MKTRTTSEEFFEQLCAERGFKCIRILESNENKKRTADYRVSLGSITLITEVKQLDQNDKDKRIANAWKAVPQPLVIATSPSDRIQGLLKDAYPQIKHSSEGKWPAMIVVYNNSGFWNCIDTFTVAKAMFGSFGVVLELQPDQKIDVAGHGYLGKRKVTKNTFRSLSVVGVLKLLDAEVIGLDCYHNPFANVRIEPALFTDLADSQYIHPNPHDRGFVPWEPRKIGA